MINYLEIVLSKFKKLFDGFEPRNEQLDMIESTYETMRNKLVSAIHAPTGTGKSLAYLIAFIAVKLENPDFTTSISTFTHKLQDQLIKDLELADKIYQSCLLDLNREAKPLLFTILKGKSNYFCNLKYNRSIDDSEISSVDEKLINQALNHIEKEKIKLERNNFKPDVSDDTWGKMNVERCFKNCSHSKTCSYFQDFVESKSDIYILNHSLYFNRQFYAGKWNYSFSIFDEAHKLDKVILDASTFSFNIKVLEEYVRKGAFLLYKYQVNKNVVNKWLIDYFHNHSFICKFKNGIEVISSNVEKGEYIYSSLGYPLDGFIQLFHELKLWLDEVTNSISFEFLEKNGKKKIKEESHAYEIEQWSSALDDIKWFDSILQKQGVLWIEKDDNNLYFRITPNDIAKLSDIFNDSLLITSGTLAVNNSCSAMAERLNLKLNIDKVLTSPFDLKANSIVYYNKNLYPYAKNYNEMASEEILSLYDIGEGKTFVLFTNLELMKSQYNKLKSKLTSKYGSNIDIYLQGQDAHEKVMTSFNNLSRKTILFGSLSYFEGIDLKGKALTQVIIVKLPYSRPNHPVQQILDSSFRYSEWEALIRFEQAYGRINRTKSDYGSFCILDNRVGKFKPFLDLFNIHDIPITSNKNDLISFYKNKSQGN